MGVAKKGKDDQGIKIKNGIFVFFLLANYWIWHVAQYNLIFFILLISSSLLFFIWSRKRNKLKYLTLVFLFIFSLFLLKKEKSIFSLSQTDILVINQNRSYYHSALFSRLLENKVTYIFHRYEKNVFEQLDINYYFFATHPRERVGITENEKFPWPLLPLFLIGAVILLRRSSTFVFLYFIFCIFLNAFFINSGTAAFFKIPFFVILITEGFYFLVFQQGDPNPEYYLSTGKPGTKLKKKW